MFVCLCKGVTDRTIRAEIERGACSPEQIAACTGAGTKCGRCRDEVASIVLRELACAPVAAPPSGRRALPMLSDEAETEPMRAEATAA